MKTEGDFLMSSLMLFQNLAPANLTDLKPYCNVFLQVIKISPLEAIIMMNSCQGFKKIVKKGRRNFINRLIHKSKQF